MFSLPFSTVVNSVTTAGSYAYKKNKGVVKATQSLYEEGSAAITKFRIEKVGPLVEEAAFYWDAASNRQLNQEAMGHDAQKTAQDIDDEIAEQELNQDLLLALGSLGLATVGTLFHAPFFSLLSVPVMLYGSIPIYKGAYETIVKEQRVDADVMAAIIQTFLIGGRYALLGNMTTASYFVSNKLLFVAKKAFAKRLNNIFKQQPHTAWVLVEDVEVEKPIEAVQVGDTVVVHTGRTIPVDGSVKEGIASVDQHILTGEAQPIDKMVGDHVFASTVVLSGRISVVAERAGDDTVAAQIGQVLQNTSDFKATRQLRAETLANQMVAPTLALALFSFPFLGPWQAAAIIDSHPKYRMSMSAPLSTLSYLNLASRHGLLVKDGRSLELIGKVDTVVFDKTGTLTLEQPHVGAIHLCYGYSEEQLLTYAAAAEHRQSHPIAKAILQEAHERQLALPLVENAEYRVGYGLTVTIDGRLIRVGSARFMEMEGIHLPQKIKKLIADNPLGTSLVMLSINNRLAGAIEMQATLRPEAKGIINLLRERDISIYILSGDHEEPTRKLANELGISNYFAETLPKDKATLVQSLQDSGRSICFVGDGLNDAVALKQAHVSISFPSASTTATDTAHIILMDENLEQMVHLFDLVQQFDKNMRNTLMLVAIPSTIGIVGALFFNFGLPHTVTLNTTGFLLSVGNSLLPWVQHRQEVLE